MYNVYYFYISLDHSIVKSAVDHQCDYWNIYDMYLHMYCVYLYVLCIFICIVYVYMYIFRSTTTQAQGRNVRIWHFHWVCNEMDSTTVIIAIKFILLLNDKAIYSVPNNLIVSIILLNTQIQSDTCSSVSFWPKCLKFC